MAREREARGKKKKKEEKIDDSLPSRDELIMYSIQLTGLPDNQVMALALLALFGENKFFCFSISFFFID